MSKQEMCTPFSSGSRAAAWYSENCEQCTKAFFPKKDGDWPSDKTVQKYCSIGKECKLKYHLDIGFITGEIPLHIAQQMGSKDGNRMPDTCLMFSDKDDDRYQPPKQPRKPRPTGPNQMVMPFIIQEIGEPKKRLQHA